MYIINLLGKIYIFLIILQFVIGDGNLHVNLTSAKFNENILNCIEPYIFERVSEFRGSISAEHGIGFFKNKYIKYSKTENEINIMKSLKSLMDPNGIMNPYKVFNISSRN